MDDRNLISEEYNILNENAARKISESCKAFEGDRGYFGRGMKVVISGSGCDNRKITDPDFKKETDWCCDNSSDKSSNNQKLREEDLKRCIQINTEFYKLKEDLKKRFSGNNELIWQTTPVIGFHESVYKEGGVIIIGYNEHVGGNDDNNFTGSARNNLLEDDRYYKFFTKDETPISNCFKTDIKFMELIPIKSSSKKKAKSLLEELESTEEEIEADCFKQLMDFLSFLKPKLILCNDKTVSNLFEIESKCKSEPQNDNCSKVRVNIEGKKVPVILSGQITGRNPLDEYNKIRFWKEIEGVLRE